ncbi:MAG TPA: acylneuraminate cytidylyltransferase family protein [Candidatus Paceibacterota bacterium]|nr:acylneuraminate cytidylyltransferase family protein [Candidatus Paceibacterota bacterium]
MIGKGTHKKKVVALVPLRGGSKSIPYKNIKEIGGMPLAYWVLKAATDSPSISEVYVSTEDPKIKEVVESLGLGVKVIKRPEELAQDLTTTDAVMMHFMQEVPDFDILFTIQATSPLTTEAELEAALDHFLKNDHDSMLTGVRTKRFFWTDDGVAHNYDYKNRPMRQQFKGTIMENGAFYITKKETLEREKNRLGGSIGVYEMPPHFAVELDEPEDWVEVEKLLLAREKGK